MQSTSTKYLQPPNYMYQSLALITNLGNIRGDWAQAGVLCLEHGTRDGSQAHVSLARVTLRASEERRVAKGQSMRPQC